MGAVVADARRFADMHALYRMYDEEGRLLYVGITGDPGQRFGDHAVKRWFPLVATVKLEWHPHRAAAAVAEKRAISAERPRYNRAGRKPKGPGELLPGRDLLADLDAVLGAERVRLSAIPPLLRKHDPRWPPYQKLTGRELRGMLARRGVRTVNPKNVPQLDPVDLRKVYRGSSRKAG